LQTTTHTGLPGVILLVVALTVSPGLSAQAVAVRNDAPRVGQQEVLMLRHAFLEKGGYQTWYEASREGVWPWFEKIGARIVGDWQVVHPDGGSEYPHLDEAWRLARYASYEHWQATRPSRSAAAGQTGGSDLLGGNGPDQRKSNASIARRRTVARGSKGGIFLQGYMAETRPIYMPGSGEAFRQVTGGGSTDSNAIAVRHDVARPNEDFLALMYWKIRKGSFEEFHALTRDGIYPFMEKIGVRPVGQWQVLYLPDGVPVESPEYDEVYLLARYASYAHYLATQRPGQLGGNGGDFEAFQAALRRRQPLTLEFSTQFLQGPLYASPPLYMPALNESYRRID
jgi:hypothetical protein